MSDKGYESPPTKKSRKFDGAAKYCSHFDQAWSNIYPVSAVKTDKFKFFCIPCRKELSCKHQGVADVKDHCSSNINAQNVRSLTKQPKLNFRVNEDLDTKVISAEVKMANFIAEHNLPLKIADHLGPLFRSAFPDSKIAAKYQSASTKTTCIINGAIAPMLVQDLVEEMRVRPYSLATDGSNDSGLEKMNPITVRIYDVRRGKIATRFLDMGITSGSKSATAESIFTSIDSKMDEFGIPWSNCVGFSVDNASVNLGNRNSIMTRALAKNQQIYFLGCPCHLSHNAAQAAGSAYRKSTGFDIEELLVDLFFWFDKSTKRKNELAEFCEFCNQEYRSVIKHGSTRWLSLEKCIERTLKQFESLKSYFRSSSEGKGQARLKRLVKIFSNPLTEIHLLFLQCALPLFNQFNLVLQKEDPVIHLVVDLMEKLHRNLLGRLIKAKAIKAAASLTDVDLDNSENQLSDAELHIGFTGKQKLRQLLLDGEITEMQQDQFFDGVRAFYSGAIKFICLKFPLNDQVLSHAQLVDFTRRLESSFCTVEFIMDRFSTALQFTDAEKDAIRDEFSTYQTLDENKIPKNVFENAQLGGDRADIKMDIVWDYLGKMTIPGTSTLIFPNLFKVANLVLTLPHSNAGEERVFSMVRKNKTEQRSSLGVKGTLANLMAVKFNVQEPCFEFNPSKEMLVKAKKATKDYNDSH